jgi:hypothetical protein
MADDKFEPISRKHMLVIPQNMADYETMIFLTETSYIFNVTE